MIRKFCHRCRTVQDHVLHKLGDGKRMREWLECEGCQKLEPRLRRQSDWGGV